MSMNDPISDLLTRIRNGQAAGRAEVSMQSSRVKEAIVRVLKDEGYVADFVVSKDGARKSLVIALKYHAGKPVIERLERVSRPGLRAYRGKDALPKVLGGLSPIDPGFLRLLVAHGLLDKVDMVAVHGDRKSVV